MPIATAQHPVNSFIAPSGFTGGNDGLVRAMVRPSVSGGLLEGLSPFVFVHSSDNIAAPTLAAQLGSKIQLWAQIIQPVFAASTKSGKQSSLGSWGFLMSTSAFYYFTKRRIRSRSGDCGTDVMGRLYTYQLPITSWNAMLREVVPLIHQVTQQRVWVWSVQDDIFDSTAYKLRLLCC